MFDDVDRDILAIRLPQARECSGTHEQLFTDVFGWRVWINNRLVLLAYDAGLAVCQSILNCGQSADDLSRGLRSRLDGPRGLCGHRGTEGRRPVR